jgi:putative transposase
LDTVDCTRGGCRMAGPLPLPITVSPPQQAVLEALLRQHATPQTLALRVRIILAAATGMRNVPLAHDLGCTPKTVIKWRARWAAAEAQLAAVEGEAADLKRRIARVLADAPRPGAPDTFTAEQIVQIVNLACTPPADAGRPVAGWTPRELADEAVKRQIVSSISPTSVGRFLKTGRSAAASQPLLAQCQNQSR